METTSHFLTAGTDHLLLEPNLMSRKSLTVLEFLLVVLVVGDGRELFWDKPLLGREEPQSQRL